MFGAVILAAGDSKRMKSDLTKVLHKICGLPIICHIIGRIQKVGIKKIAIVVGKNKKQIQECVERYFENSGLQIEFIEQEERLGTAHAVSMAKNFIAKNNIEDVLILCGDTPLITEKTISEFINFYESNKNDAIVLTTKIPDATGYGRIVKNEDKLLKIVEQRDANQEELEIGEVNSGIYIFKSKNLLDSLGKVSNDNAQKEYYLTDTVQFVENCGIFEIPNPDEVLGINDRFQLYQVSNKFNKQLILNQIKKGVTFINPDNTYLDFDVEIDNDTIVYPGCHLKNKTKIGKHCVIGPNTTIEGCQLGDYCQIEYSVLRNSIIKDNVKIGPFAHVRPDCSIQNGVKIGDFVEIKNSQIGENTKIPHLSYIGDADVGKSVNFGCGSIVVNYDGKKKYRSCVKDNSFIGCNSNLISPIKLGEQSFIAAGSTITQNVPDNALAIARSKQVNKENWVARRDENTNQ